MNKLMKYLPDYYSEIQEFHEITETQNIELEKIDEQLNYLFANQFIMTAQDEALIRREKLFSIMADKTETLEFRRLRITNRQTTRPPFTEIWLQRQLDFLLGKEKAVVSVDAQNYILCITMSISNASLFREILQTIEKVVPLNLIYVQNREITDALYFGGVFCMGKTMVIEQSIDVLELSSIHIDTFPSGVISTHKAITINQS